MKVSRNIIFNKAGGNSGKNTMNYKISMPADMVRALGITKEDRSVTLELLNDKIEIKKASKD